MTNNAFLIHIQVDLRGNRIFAFGRLESGESFALVDDQWKPKFYIREELSEKARSMGFEPRGEMHSFGMQKLVAIEVKELGTFRSCSDRFENEGFETWEGDRSIYQLWLRDKGLGTSCVIVGESKPGILVQKIFKNPTLLPSLSHTLPSLRIASLDIETNEKTQEITAIAIVSGEETWSGISGQEKSERSLLSDFFNAIQKMDPDIITGWNILDFDLLRIYERSQVLKIPFLLGRTREPDFFYKAEGGKSAGAIISGRQVIDALRLIRSSGEEYDNYKLETISQKILGRGKTIPNMDIDEHIAMWKNEPELYLDYCIEDARLVWDLLSAKNLISLTQKRSALTGMPLDGAWTTIASFEQFYATQLRKFGLIEPRVQKNKSTGSPGGTVFEPRPVLTDNVIVFDFRSLYPSVIRTFNIDPYSRANAVNLKNHETIETLNNARFSKDRGILPQFTDFCFEERIRAIEKKDLVASHVYKILMNGFYGILGSPLCRYAHKDLAGAVTSMGAYALFFARKYFMDQGFDVLYGDTDSVFVHVPNWPNYKEGKDWALKITHELNEELSKKIELEFGLFSYIELRFDKIYRKFLIPKLKSGAMDDEGAKGRAKGYAGLLVTENEEEALDIKGMEAVRKDIPEIGRFIQTRLIEMLFSHKNYEEISNFIQTTILELEEGKRDSELIFTKKIRRDPISFILNTPPHIKAALDAGLKKFRGTVQYLQTTEGPQLISNQRARIDYDYYTQTYILAIARPLLDLRGWKFENRSDFSQGELF